MRTSCVLADWSTRSTWATNSTDLKSLRALDEIDRRAPSASSPTKATGSKTASVVGSPLSSSNCCGRCDRTTTPRVRRWPWSSSISPGPSGARPAEHRTRRSGCRLSHDRGNRGRPVRLGDDERARRRRRARGVTTVFTVLQLAGAASSSTSARQCCSRSAAGRTDRSRRSPPAAPFRRGRHNLRTRGSPCFHHAASAVFISHHDPPLSPRPRCRVPGDRVSSGLRDHTLIVGAVARSRRFRVDHRGDCHGHRLDRARRHGLRSSANPLLQLLDLLPGARVQHLVLRQPSRDAPARSRFSPIQSSALSWCASVSTESSSLPAARRALTSRRSRRSGCGSAEERPRLGPFSITAARRRRRPERVADSARSDARCSERVDAPSR